MKLRNKEDSIKESFSKLMRSNKKNNNNASSQAINMPNNNVNNVNNISKNSIPSRFSLQDNNVNGN
jgi:hypothetical protein